MCAARLSAAPLPLLPRVAALSRSAPSSASRRRSLSLSPLLSRAAAAAAADAAALLRPSRPPPQRCSPGRRRSSLLSPPVLPPSLPQRHRRPEPRRRGTRVCIPLTLNLSSLASVRAFADRFHRHPRLPSSPVVRRRPTQTAAPLGAGVQNGTARHAGALAGPCPGRDVGTAALRGTARRSRRVPACRAPACPCRAARLATYSPRI